MPEPLASWVILALLAGAAPPDAEPRTRTLAAAASPEGDVPGYVVSGAASASLPDWLGLGLEERLRYEDRASPRREAALADLSLGLTRTRAWVGIGSDRSPLRLSVELEDARQFATDLPATSVTVNEVDLLQLRLRVALARGSRLPVAIDAGRLSLDLADRRLLGRNRFRNTTNAFEGARVGLGLPGARLRVEGLALWPTERRTESLDGLDERQKLFGAVVALTRSRLVVEPYYLYYRSEAGDPTRLHTSGVHLFGEIGGFDHDFHAALQLGSVAGAGHRAFAFHGEIGRSFATALAPRVAGWLNYASGDRDPDDARSERFDALFGVTHTMYGYTDLFGWQNLLSPTAALSLRPCPSMRVQVMYRPVWLASSRDALARAGLWDPTGQSGSFVGQELDVELRWSLFSFLELNAQYGELFPGEFVTSTGGRGARSLALAMTLSTS